MKIYYRNCPRCNKEVKHRNRHSWWFSKKHNRICVSCAKKGNVPWNKGIPHSEETLRKISQSLKGRTFSKEWTDRISKAHRKRLSKRLRGQNRCPRYNLTACKVFDEINEGLGLSGRHGTNGGEFFVNGLGYWLDFYDKEVNVVIEYHERHHKRKKIQKRDERREREVKKVLGCRYFVIREDENWREIVNANILQA